MGPSDFLKVFYSQRVEFLVTDHLCGQERPSGPLPDLPGHWKSFFWYLACFLATNNCGFCCVRVVRWVGYQENKYDLDTTANIFTAL